MERIASRFVSRTLLDSSIKRLCWSFGRVMFGETLIQEGWEIALLPCWCLFGSWFCWKGLCLMWLLVPVTVIIMFLLLFVKQTVISKKKITKTAATTTLFLHETETKTKRNQKKRRSRGPGLVVFLLRFPEMFQDDIWEPREVHSSSVRRVPEVPFAGMGGWLGLVVLKKVKNMYKSS